MTHGTVTAYEKHRCRCDTCRSAYSEHQRRRRQGPARVQRPAPDTSWMADAACRGMDPELFFPVQGEDTRPAREVCFSCPMRARCLSYALDNREAYGVWGGLSVKGRETLTGRRMPRGRVS